MKKVYCSGPGCGKRRISWSQPYQPRGTQIIDVPDDYVGPAYCSIECAAYAGALK